MLDRFCLKEPFFEIGPKAYCFGKNALQLAMFADDLVSKYDVDIIFTPQTIDIPKIAANTHHIKIFSQHMDGINIGRGMGCILPEALAEAGAHGTFLNHAEHPLSLEEISRGILRANEVGLAALVCANNLEEACAIACFHPDIIIVENSAQIASNSGYTNPKNIMTIRRAIHTIDKNIKILFGAGIHSPQDVEEVIRYGADATGCSSAIMCAKDPLEQTEAMICALRNAWDKKHVSSM